MIQRHHRHSKPAIVVHSNQISQILFITAILTVFFAASEPLLTGASGQQPDWLGSAGSWPYKFASARHVYSPEAIKPTPGRPQADSRQYETKLNLSSTNGRLNRPARQESRYRYELATPSTAMRPLSSIQVQLAELRRQLDTEELRRQVALGSPCLRASDCSNSIKGSHCKLDTFTCSCLPYHVELNSTTCLPPSLLGFECQMDAQCQKKVADSYCSPSSGLCVCRPNLVTYRRDKCLAASKLNDYCLTDRQCQLADKHSHCKWKIPHVYGLCKCPPNYKPITMPEQHWQAFAEHEQQQQLDDQVEGFQQLKGQSKRQPLAAGSSAMRTRCAPRLGDSCFDRSDCLLATPNSTCRLAEPNDSFRPGWPSSNVSALRCFCEPGFAVAPNRLDCVPLVERQSISQADQTITSLGPPLALPAPTQLPARSSPAEPSSAQLAASTQMDDKHHYELVSPDSLKTDHETSGRVDLPPASKRAETTNATKTSSLGKACRTRAECQARDKFSDCVSGRCDCMRPSRKCSANFTGCHKDTFQCRNGQCISWYFVCDRFKNCDDGSDEDECQPGKCPPEAFQCQDGTCLSRAKLCNGRPECLDGSDELHCNNNSADGLTWPTNTTTSKGGLDSGQQQRLYESQAAEHPPATRRKDAAPGQLQLVNVPLRGLCHASAFQCDNGQCLPAYVFCNAVEDCLDGSDERDWLCERHQLTVPVSPLAPGKWLSALGGGQPASTYPSATISAASKQPVDGSGAPMVSPAAGAAQPSNPSSSSSSTKDSPLVKADRNSIDKMLAALNLAGRGPESRLQPAGTRNRSRFKRADKPAPLPDADGLTRRKRNKVPIQRRRESKLTRFEQQQQEGHLIAAIPVGINNNFECPKSSFTCANGKCRSSAILCSGVDGCGDNSDEDRCQVCQCEAP